MNYLLSISRRTARRLAPRSPKTKAFLLSPAVLILSLLFVLLTQQSSWAGRTTRGLSAEPAHARKKPVLDLAARPLPGQGYTLFVAEGKTGKVYYKDVSQKKDVDSWDLAEFSVFEMHGPQIPRAPVGLAATEKVLYILDKHDSAVFAVDLQTRYVVRVLEEPAIKNPLSIAVSDRGILAIGQDDRNVLLYDPVAPSGAGLKELPGKVDEPVRLQFLRSSSKELPSILVLDADLAQLLLYEPDYDHGESYRVRSIRIPEGITSQLQGADTSLDMCYIDGNVYLSQGENWAVFSLQAAAESRWVTFPDMYKWKPGRFRSLGNLLFVLDPESKKVLQLSLSMMTLRLEVDASGANALLTDLYKTLWDKGALPERHYVVPVARASFKDLLRMEHVLAPGSYQGIFPAESGDSQKQLEQTLCQLNKSVNRWSCPDGTAGSSASLTREFGRGQLLVIPGLGIEGARYEGTEYLNNRTVEEAVKARLMLADPHQTISTEYLMRVNPDYYRTLDYELTRRGFILASTGPASLPLAQGSLIQIVNNREVPISSDCLSPWALLSGQKQSQPLLGLSEKLRLYTVSLEHLPRTNTRTADKAVLLDWNKRGIKSIDVLFDQPVEERARAENLAQAAFPECWNGLFRQDRYLIADVLKVSGIKYRLLKQDGKLAQLKQEDLARWGLAGTVDEYGEWSVVFGQPFVLAYRPIPWDGNGVVANPPAAIQSLTKPRARYVIDPHSIKPGSDQDTWSKASGRFVLPGFRWELKILTDSSMLAENSVLRQWASKYADKVYVWPSPRTKGDSKPSSLAEKIGWPGGGDLNLVRQNRDQVFKSISFPATANSKDITVGLMERTASINKFNPDFAWRVLEPDCSQGNDCSWEFVWLEPSEDPSGPLERLRHLRGNPARAVKSQAEIDAAGDYWKENHGTHIAGLLASNSIEAKGLLPDAAICWLELGNPQLSLPDQVSSDNVNSLRVINISQEFVDATYDQWLKEQLESDSALSSRLLVISAGNEGVDLNTNIAANPRLNGLHSFKSNVLTVSASDLDQQLLRTPWLRVSDFSNVPGLVAKLSAHQDPLSAYLFENLKPETQQLLAQAEQTQSIKRSLADELNTILRGPILFEQARFAGVTLRSETSAALSANVSGAELVALNRLLLEDAFTDEIVRHHYRVNYGMRLVDLLAPGKDIYSSTGGGDYAPGTGTSQAAPLVTAAAALLAKQIGGDPAVLKARLIYTGDWEGANPQAKQQWDAKNSYLETVWGGFLNAERAISWYDHDVFTYDFGSETRTRAIHGIQGNQTLTIKNATSAVIIEQRKAGEKFKVALGNGDLKFDQILRLTRLRNGLYRIIYRERDSPWRLRIIMDAVLGSGGIKFTDYEDVVDGKFVDRDRLSQAETIRFTSIVDYVGDYHKMLSKISFYNSQ